MNFSFKGRIHLFKHFQITPYPQSNEINHLRSQSFVPSSNCCYIWPRRSEQLNIKCVFVIFIHSNFIRLSLVASFSDSVKWQPDRDTCIHKIRISQNSLLQKVIQVLKNFGLMLFSLIQIIFFLLFKYGKTFCSSF